MDHKLIPLKGGLTKEQVKVQKAEEGLQILAFMAATYNEELKRQKVPAPMRSQLVAAMQLQLFEM